MAFGIAHERTPGGKEADWTDSHVVADDGPVSSPFGEDALARVVGGVDVHVGHPGRRRQRKLRSIDRSRARRRAAIRYFNFTVSGGQA